MSPVRSYEVDARSTDVFGRVLWSCRDQHFVADGPVHNGCPGEAVTPAELFLAGIASCGVELVQVVARNEGTAVGAIRAQISGHIDPDHPSREDVTVFTSFRLELEQIGRERPFEPRERGLDPVGRMAQRRLAGAGGRGNRVAAAPTLEQSAEGDRRSLAGSQLPNEAQRRPR